MDGESGRTGDKMEEIIGTIEEQRKEMRKEVKRKQ